MGENSGEMDERFREVSNDPRFRRIKVNERKVKIDKRFEGMFKDKRFTLKYSSDKRGRPVKHLTGEDMKKYYDLKSDEEEDDRESDEKTWKEDKKKRVKEHKDDNAVRKIETDEDDESSDESDGSDPKLKGKFPDARGHDKEDWSSSSSEDDEDKDEDGGAEAADTVNHQWSEFDQGAERSDETSNRIAVCNVDWDRIKATDIYVLFTSFKPPGGAIVSAKVYPSEYGIKKMQEEEEHGPAELVSVKLAEGEKDPHAKKNKKHNEDDDDLINGDSEYITERMRQYQINRLKYYYAVVECDCRETATVLYDQLDGMEYESSASTLDLRFIPDELDFHDDEPKSECTSMPDFTTYKPPIFISTALQQSKVKLTWDETDPERQTKFQQVFSNKNEKSQADDLKAYLASSEEDEDEDPIEERALASGDSEAEDEPTFSSKLNKYKALLNELDEKEREGQPDMDMEITWEPNLANVVTDLEKNAKIKDATVFEEQRSKKRDEKKLRKKSHKTNDSDKKADETEDALELIVMDEEEDERTSGRKHFNYEKMVVDKNDTSRKNKNKRKQDTSDEFKVNAEDPRFSAIYSSHLFNIEQSSPHFKRTEGMETLITNKVQKLGSSANNEKTIKVTTDETRKSDPSLSSLVKSVKSKAKHAKMYGKT